MIMMMMMMMMILMMMNNDGDGDGGGADDGGVGDEVGEEIFLKKYSNYVGEINLEIDLRNRGASVYFISVSDNDSTNVRKVIVQ